MNDWPIRVARGWREEHVPCDVKDVLKGHNGHDKLAALCLRAVSNSEGIKSTSDLPFYGQTTDLDTVALVMGAITSFIAHLTRDDLDLASLTFVNFKPHTFSLSPRPTSVAKDAPSILEGLGWFSQSVEGSITA